MRRKSTDRPRPSPDSGATLPELLVVLVVLGVLAAGVSFAVRNIRSEAQTAACGAEWSAIEIAVERWHHDTDEAPTRARLIASGYLRNESTGFEIDDSSRLVPIDGGRCEGYEDGRPDIAAGPVTGGAADTSATDPNGSVVASDLEFSLAWSSNADLDIWVRTPSGQMVSWVGDADGGQLDRDVVPAEPADVGPHVVAAAGCHAWRPDNALDVWAEYRTPGWGDQPAAEFVLSVRKGDEVLDTLTGPIKAPGEASEAMRVTVTA